MPHCTSSSTSSRPCSSHSLRRPLQELVRADAHAALALHRLDHDGRRLRADGFLRGLEVAEGHQIEAGGRLAEAFQVFLVAGGGDGGQRAAVERALEGDDAPPLGMAVGEVVAPRQLDGALAGFGAGVGEEHLVGEGRLAQPLGEALLAGDAVEVGAVPQLAGLLGQRRDQLGVRVAQRVDGDAAGEIEVALARGGDEPRALALLEGDVLAGVGGHHGGRGARRRLGRLGLGRLGGDLAGVLGGLHGRCGHGKTYLALLEKTKSRASCAALMGTRQRSVIATA